MLGKSVTNYLVDENYNVRCIINGRENRVWKEGESAGTGSYAGGGGYNPGYNPSYGSSSSSSAGSSGSSGSVTKPQYTKTCGVCHGTGTCNICAGDGWVTPLNGENHLCPSCRNHDGKCTSCGGRGTWKE